MIVTQPALWMTVSATRVPTSSVAMSLADATAKQMSKVVDAMFVKTDFGILTSTIQTDAKVRWSNCESILKNSLFEAFKVFNR